jgi:Na+/H+-translocating membrane pyrophosphatase
MLESTGRAGPAPSRDKCTVTRIPAVNPMIKVTNIVAILLLAALAHGAV